MNPKYFAAGPMHSMHPAHPYLPPHPQHHHGHGFCNTCSHPIAQCVCHRDCRKIEKELLVQPTAAAGVTTNDASVATSNLNRFNVAPEVAQQKVTALMDLIAPLDTGADEKKSSDALLSTTNIQQLRSLVTKRAVAYGVQSAIIGGGCCVHLSIEYMPLSPLSKLPALSGALVMDSNSTMLAWGKFFDEDGYHVKECIISTNPGAYLWVVSLNSVTRVRWCEIISC